MKILKSELNEGVTFLLKTNHGEDAEVYKQDGEYKIWFEGKVVHVSKSYQSLMERFNRLNREHGFTLSAD